MNIIGVNIDTNQILNPATHRSSVIYRSEGVERIEFLSTLIYPTCEGVPKYELNRGLI